MVERIRDIVEISGKDLFYRILGIEPLPPTPESYIDGLTAHLNKLLAFTAWVSPTVEAFGFPTVHFRTINGPRGVIFFDLSGPRFDNKAPTGYLSEVNIGTQGTWELMDRIRLHHPYGQLVFFMVTDKRITAADAAVLGIEGLHPFDGVNPAHPENLGARIQRRFWKVTVGRSIRTPVTAEVL